MILKKSYGGEDLFSRHIAKWIAAMKHEVTLIGIELAGLRVRHITHYDSKSEVNTTTKKSNNRVAAYRNRHLLYSLRSIFWIIQVFRIISVNTINPIDIIHAQDSGYTGLAAIIAGKILSIPVIITLHGIRYYEINQTRMSIRY